MNRILRKIIAAFTMDSIDDPVFFIKAGKTDEDLFDDFQQLIQQPKPPEDTSSYSEKKDDNARVLWIANHYNKIVKYLYYLCKNHGLQRWQILQEKAKMNAYDHYINKLEKNNELKISGKAQEVYPLLTRYQDFNAAVSDKPSEMGLGGLDILDKAICDGIQQHYQKSNLVESIREAEEDFKAKKQNKETQAKDFKDFVRQFEIVSSNNENTSDKRDKGGKNVNRGYTR